MENAFNNLAATYDKEFTFTPTGILQRKQVLSYLQKQIIDKKSLNILELNCGTGEDAVQLAKWGHRIVATDGSKEMIRIAKTKNETPEGLPPLFRELAFDKICRENFEEQFDLVFSNFGGLNCINKDELETLFLHLIPLLKPGGRFIGVVMPRYCLWEIIYFAYKGRWKECFRRSRKGLVSAYIQGHPLNIWYYSPRQILNLASGYHAVTVKPIGFILPPSYLDNFFQNKRGLLKILLGIERIAFHIPSLSACSDHFLFDMELG